MTWKKWIILTVSSFTLGACGSPLLNAQDSPKNNPQKPNVTKEGQNFLQLYGCPLRFDAVDLCAQIFWYDAEGKSSSGPVYYQNYRDFSISAQIVFWSAKDGWPIDPRVEFKDAKFVKVKLFMPSMGHGTMGYIPTVQQNSKRVGQFQIKNIRFVMQASEKHPWDFRIQLKNAHDDADYDSADEPEKEPNVWKQKIIRFTSLESR